MARGRPRKSPEAISLHHLIGWHSSFSVAPGPAAGRPRKHELADADLAAAVEELLEKGCSESQALVFLANYVVQDAKTLQLRRERPELAQNYADAWNLASEILSADPEGSRRAVLAMKEVLKKRLPAARRKK